MPSLLTLDFTTMRFMFIAPYVGIIIAEFLAKAPTQVITGLEVDELTAVHFLDAATWQQRRQRLQELGGPPEQ
jgi:hypothetical protein